MDTDSLLRPNIRNIVPYSTARNEYAAKGGTVFLDANENPFNNGLNRYPDPEQKQLKSKISEKWGIPAENIFAGNGSDEIIDLLIRAFCEPGRDKIMITPPTYGMYEVSANINGVETLKVNLNENFELNTSEMIRNCDNQLKIIFICSPNNPTGNSFQKTEIERLLIESNAIVVIDEAYQDFSANESWRNQIGKFPNLVVLQTFSKSRGMAGIRLGLAFAREKIIKVLTKIKLPYNLNNLSIGRALECVENEDNYLIQREQIKKEREKLAMNLKELNFMIQVFRSDANFILCRVKNATETYNFLANRGIIVRNRSGQVHCDNCLRFSVGTPDENDLLIKSLKEFETIK